MRRQMIENAAFEVATQVRAVEDSIDGALAEMAELQIKMMRVSSVAQVGPAPIHAALEEMTSAQRCLVEARRAIVNCHGELVTAKEKVPGLRTVSFGDEGPCPKTAHVDLRVVA